MAGDCPSTERDPVKILAGFDKMYADKRAREQTEPPRTVFPVSATRDDPIDADAIDKMMEAVDGEPELIIINDKEVEFSFATDAEATVGVQILTAAEYRAQRKPTARKGGHGPTPPTTSTLPPEWTAWRKTTDDRMAKAETRSTELCKTTTSHSERLDNHTAAIQQLRLGQSKLDARVERTEQGIADLQRASGSQDTIMTLIGVRLGMRKPDMSDPTQVEIAIASGHLEPGTQASTQPVGPMELNDDAGAHLEGSPSGKKRDMPAASLKPGDTVFYLPDPTEGELSRWVLVAATTNGNWIAAQVLPNGQAAVDRAPTELTTSMIFTTQTAADYEAACRLSKEPKRPKRAQAQAQG